MNIRVKEDTLLICNICGNPNLESKCKRIYDDCGELEALACPHCGSEDLEELV